MDNQMARGKIVEVLKDLLADDVGALMDRYGPDPEAVIGTIQEKLRPLLSIFSEHDRQLNLEVYRMFADLIGEAFGVRTEDALEWVLSKVDDEDCPPNPEKQNLVQDCESALDRPIVMRVVFRRDEESGSYERKCELFVMLEEKSAKKLEAVKAVGWDGIQSDVQEHFLRSGDTEVSFHLFASVQEKEL